jgi:hypothetical protein
MSRKRPDPPPIDTLEEDFLLAIDRLERGMPGQSALQKLGRLRKLRINKSTVAVEAGHSRTKIYDYPRVVARIQDLQTPVQAALTAREVIGHLRQENAQLRRDKREALSALAAMVIRLEQMEKEYRRRIREIERELARRRDDPSEIGGNVIPMPRGLKRKR